LEQGKPIVSGYFELNKVLLFNSKKNPPRGLTGRRDGKLHEKQLAK
jgi:hypothetical protein